MKLIWPAVGICVVVFMMVILFRNQSPSSPETNHVDAQHHEQSKHISGTVNQGRHDGFRDISGTVNQGRHDGFRDISGTVNQGRHDGFRDISGTVNQGRHDGFRDIKIWLSGRQISLPWDLYPYKPYNESTRLIARALGSKDQKTLLDMFDQYLAYIPYDCRRRGRFGEYTIQGSGGYDICLAGPYMPKENCLIYSFGVGYYWTFEDMMAEEFGCLSRTFDPTMGTKEYQHAPNVMFYPYGIGKENKARLKTMKTFLQEYGEEKRIIDILKIDVEGAEYPSFPVIFQDNILPRVKQLVMEIHVGKEASVDFMQKVFTIFRQLEELGFRKWSFRETPYGESPYKSTLLKRWRFLANDINFINMNFLDPAYNPSS